MKIVAAKVQGGSLMLLVDVGGRRMVAMQTMIDRFEVNFLGPHGGFDGEVTLKVFEMARVDVPDDWRDAPEIEPPPLAIPGPEL